MGLLIWVVITVRTAACAEDEELANDYSWYPEWSVAESAAWATSSSRVTAEGALLAACTSPPDHGAPRQVCGQGKEQAMLL